MTASYEAHDPVPESSHGALADLMASFVTHQMRRSGGDVVATPEITSDRVAIRSADVVQPGRPGLVSVIATVPAADLPGADLADGGAPERTIHAVLGLRSPGEEVQFLIDADDAPLGIYEDEDGLAVVFDGLADAELSLALLRVVAGDQSDLERVRRLAVNSDAVSLTFDDRLVFTVFQSLPEGELPHAGVELVLRLDEVGFNHLGAPHALWRRGSTDLGIVQEYQAGSTAGWTLALTSLRDLYATGGAPELAGGDFATEAEQLGTMTARMHLGLSRAFGQRHGRVGSWASAAEELLELVGPDSVERSDAEGWAKLAELARSDDEGVAIRTHGDYHLGRVARTDLGWFVNDFSPGGVPAYAVGVVPAGSGQVDYRSPLADVADMLWSFHHVAEVAAVERDPHDNQGLRQLAQAWETRNRRAFFRGYLATPGIEELMPSTREMARRLAVTFEQVRAAVSPTVVPA